MVDALSLEVEGLHPLFYEIRPWSVRECLILEKFGLSALGFILLLGQ